ncbi:RNA polymerase sigma-70 factor, ECF subfamily [Cnuella takakiae]|uniref:RNA polymerase sigma-70 factor, ECF subfamily n=1 Tax=Cnuella takakiae TaxID=1302690 RepID=A0A1M5DZG6_9BACT|nr:sigma-70 family RNA polymerase sigma factor [Cnuella takakiae]OLY93827.1 hypothetical protein BUE76_19525 [Cnuella takakiae]SHF72231.1 RNA polymerase sigma-70 factor, ECF subfamily [Cnuella takakiae]
MVATTQLSDEELVLQVRLGCERSFTLLLRRHQPLLNRIACRYVKDFMLAEDLVQEISIRMYTAIRAGRYSEEGKFVVWLKRVGRNICLDYLRKPSLPCIHPEVLPEVHQVHAPSPEDLLIARQTHQQVRKLVTQLPDTLRQVVYYRHYEEISYKEIAAKMGTSINTSLGRMRYGLKHLRNGYLLQ